MIASKRSRASRREQPEHDRVDHDVVARRQLEVEADAELDERRQPTADHDLAVVGVVDPGDALQQRALAAAVAADDPEELALRDLDADVLDGLEHVERARLERMQRPLLQRVVLPVGELEGLRDAVQRHRERL